MIYKSLRDKLLIPSNFDIKILNVYCDGSCLNNGKKADTALGIGVHFPLHTEFDLSLGIKDPNLNLTNNLAEILAALFSLKQSALIIKQFPKKYEKLIIHSDSRYVTTGMNEWVTKWIENGWKGYNNKIISNKDGFEALVAESMKLKNIEIEWKHVKGHAGDASNEVAHKLANKASKEISLKELE